MSTCLPASEQSSFSFDKSDASIQERFLEFHERHPEVCAYLVAICYDLKRKGFRKYGIRGLWERARWHFQVEKELGAEYKLNDHFHSRYSRLIVKEHPDLDGFFEFRELKS